MKPTFLVILSLAAALNVHAQTRAYLAVGMNSQTNFTSQPNFNLGLTNNAFSLGAEFTTQAWKYARIELNIEQRISGSLYLLTGLSGSQSGYTYDYGFGSSELRNTYLSVPLLFRYNFGNSHTLYFDAGLIENYLAYANLNEHYGPNSAEGNIASHLTRFSTTFSFQFNIVINRFVISTYSISKNWSTASDFSDQWGLPRNESVFLLYITRFSHTDKGIKLSYRLR